MSWARDLVAEIAVPASKMYRHVQIQIPLQDIDQLRFPSLEGCSSPTVVHVAPRTLQMFNVCLCRGCWWEFSFRTYGFSAV